MSHNNGSNSSSHTNSMAAVAAAAFAGNTNSSSTLQKRSGMFNRRNSRGTGIGMTASASYFELNNQQAGGAVAASRSKNTLQNASGIFGNAGPGHSSVNRMGASSRQSHNLMNSLTVSGTKNNTLGATGMGHGVCVLDDEGNDVTPVSLMAPSKGGFKLPQGADIPSMSTAIKETVADVLNNLESMTGGSWNNSSTFGKSGGMSYSSSSRASGASSPDEKDDDSSSVASNDSNDDKVDDDAQSTRRPSSIVSYKHSKHEKEEDLQRMVHLKLTETDNIILFDLPSLSVSSEFIEEASAVKYANSKYSELVSTKANNDNFQDHGMQTYNFSLKNKDVQATGPSFATAECMVNEWSIYDTYHAVERHNAESREGGGNYRDVEIEPMIGLDKSIGSSDTRDGLSSTRTDSIALVQSRHDIPGRDSRSLFASEDAGSDATFSLVGGQNASGDGATDKAFDTIIGGGDLAQLNMLNQDNLRNSLMIIERAVVGNNYESRLLMYRNMGQLDHMENEVQAGEQSDSDDGKDDDDEGEDDEVEGEGKEAEETENQSVDNQDEHEGEESSSEENLIDRIPILTSLWSYKCELTRGRTVYYMSWNKQNEDILAVAYGECKIGASGSPGLILCWSLKNPEWPERIYRSNTEVTAIDFSKVNPNLLAAGFADGRIAIYDVRKKDDVHILDNSDNPGKHRDPVWELKWIEKERVLGDDNSKGEALISVSTDGRVCQWLIRKGFTYTELMVLKRVTKQESKSGSEQASNANGNGASKTAFISRQAGGLCFDFNPNDSNIYVVGTEDGHLHKCSCSYNEQYLSTQYGHTGPIYKIKWSPFLDGTYITCSADWTIQLWGADEERSLFKFQSGKDAITDVAWSPSQSTTFGCVSSDGRMEIWDLRFSVIDPIILHTVLDRQLTSIIFGSKSPTVLTGDDNGAVSVYNLRSHISDRKVNKTSPDWRENQATVLEDVIRKKI